MDTYQMGASMVVENEMLVGVIPEQDITRNVVLKNRSSKITRVGGIINRGR